MLLEYVNFQAKLDAISQCTKYDFICFNLGRSLDRKCIETARGGVFFMIWMRVIIQDLEN